MASSAGYSALPKGSMADEEEVEKAAQLRNKLEAGLLRSLARLAERSPTPRSVMLLYLLVDILQLLIIPLSPSSAMPWGSSPIMDSVYKFLLYINLLPRNPADSVAGLPFPYPALDLSVASIVLCALFTSAFLYMWLSDALSPPDAPQSAWKTRIVWYLAPVFMHAILVPMVAGLLAPLSCVNGASGGTWMSSDLACWSGGHVSLVIAGVVVCIAFLAVMLLLAVAIVDRRVEVAGKDNPSCAVHGRIDAAMVLLRSAFAAFFIFGFSSTPWATVIISIVAGLAYIVAYGMWFPYYRLHVNQSFAVGGSVLLSAGIGSARAVGTAASGSADSNNGVVLFFFMVLPCAFCAYSALSFRWKSFASMTDLSTPYLVELKARTLIIDVVEPALREQAINRNSSRGGSGTSSSSYSDLASVGKGRSSGVSVGSRNRDDRDGDEAHSARSGMSEKQPAAGAGARSRSARSGNSYASGNNVKHGAGGSAAGVEGAAAGANGCATVGDALRLIDAMYRDAAHAMNGSALLDIFAASYLGAIRNNRHLERLHLKTALAKAGTWALDVRAFAFMREEAIIAREADDSSSRMTVQKRIELEELTMLSRQQVNVARALVLSFWESLSVRSPDLSKLQKTGAAINKALTEADATFKRLMVLAPQSPSLLRAYAEYLLELANDSRKGMELINDAEQIEDEQSRARTAAANDDVDFLLGQPIAFDLSADSVAMIRVSAEPDSVGTVLGINAPAQKLLGFSAREITGRNVDGIIPSPIADVHDGFLHRYLADGREFIVGTSRSMFLQHRNGHIVPARVSIAKSLTGDEWFTCAEEITTNWMFFIVLGEESAWRMTAACKSAMALLGVEGPAIKSGSVSLQNYVGDIEDLMAQFEVNADKSVLVRLLVADPAAAASAALNAAGSARSKSSGRKTSYGSLTSSSTGGKGHNGHGKSAAPFGVLVAARAQSFAVPGLDAPFHILRFRPATDADRSLMPLDAGAPGQPSGVAGEGRGFRPEDDDEPAAGHRARGGLHHHDASGGVQPLRSPANKHVSFGEQRTAASRAWGGLAGGSGSQSDSSDDESPRAPARPPTPPSGRRDRDGSHSQRQGSSRSSGGTGMHHVQQGRAGMPAGHPTGGDISLCPVMGAGMRSQAGAGAAGSSGRAMLQTPHPSARKGMDLRDHAPGSTYTSAAGSMPMEINLGMGAMPQARHVAGPAFTAAPVPLPGPAPATIDLGADIFRSVTGVDSPALSVSLTPNALPGIPISPPLSSPPQPLSSHRSHLSSASSASPAQPQHSQRSANSNGSSPAAVAESHRSLSREAFNPAAAVAFAAASAAAAAAAAAADVAGSEYTSGSMTDPSAPGPQAAPGHGHTMTVSLTAGSGAGAAAGAAESGLPVQAAADGPKRRISLSLKVRGSASASVASPDGAASSMPKRTLTFARSPRGDAPAYEVDANAGAEGVDAESEEGVDSARAESARSPRDGDGKATASPAVSTPLVAIVPIRGPAATAGGAGDSPAVDALHTDVLTSSPVPKNGAGYNGSVHSGSKGSGGSGISVSDIIRKGVHAKSKSLEGSLVVLRRSIIVAFIIIAVASIVSLATTTVLFQQMIDNMQIVQMTGERFLALQRVYGDIQSLQLFNKNVTFLPAGGTLKIESLKANIATFESYHQQLYARVDGAVTAEVELYTLPSSLTVSDLVPGTYVNYDHNNVTTRGISFMNAGAEYVARARRIANTPVASIVESHPDAFWIETAGQLPLRLACNTSMLLADSRSERQATTIELANNIVLGVGLGILALIACAVITPAVFRVLKAKSQIFDIFLAVPLTVTKALRARTARRVQAAVQEEDGDDVAMDLDVEDRRADTGDEDEGLAAVAMAANGGKGRPRADSASVGGESAADDDIRAGMRRCSSGAGSGDGSPAAAAAGAAGAADAGATSKAAASSTASKSKRRYSKAASATGRLLLHMLLPVLIYGVYFIGSYVWREQTVAMARHARSEVLQVHQLEFFARRANFNARSALAYTEPKFAAEHVTRGRVAYSQVYTLSSALLYGSERLNTRATLQLYDDVKTLWNSYACFDNGGFYYAVPACESWHDAMMSRTALLGAVQDYLNLVRVNLDFAVLHPDEALDLNVGDALLMQQYGTTYLPPAFSAFSRIITEQPTKQLNQYNTLNLLVTVVSILALFCFYAFIYSPLIRRLDSEIKNVRGLLLIFPDEVSRNTAAIVSAGREMLKDTSSVVGGGTSVVSSASRSRRH